MNVARARPKCWWENNVAFQSRPVTYTQPASLLNFGSGESTQSPRRTGLPALTLPPNIETKQSSGRSSSMLIRSYSVIRCCAAIPSPLGRNGLIAEVPGRFGWIIHTTNTMVTTPPVDVSVFANDENQGYPNRQASKKPECRRSNVGHQRYVDHWLL